MSVWCPYLIHWLSSVVSAENCRRPLHKKFTSLDSLGPNEGRFFTSTLVIRVHLYKSLKFTRGLNSLVLDGGGGGGEEMGKRIGWGQV